MKYTVSVNEKSKTVTVDLDGHKGVAKCCETDQFNLATGIELALERAKVAKKGAEASKSPITKSGDVMELVKALEKALPKGQMVIVGGGDNLTADQKRWLANLAGVTPCNCHDEDCYTDDEIEDIRNAAYDEGYDDGYDEGYTDGVAECDDEVAYAEDMVEEMAERVREVLDEYAE